VLFDGELIADLVSRNNTRGIGGDLLLLVLRFDGAFERDRAIQCDDLDVVGVRREIFVCQNRFADTGRNLAVSFSVRLAIRGLCVIFVALRIVGYCLCAIGLRRWIQA
jgi:hypothetical protein